MADNKNAYVGKISNSGSQVVKAPVTANEKRGKAIVKKGDDLRNCKK